MKRSIPELDKLFEEVGTYRKGSDFEELLQFIKKFPRLAPYNAMLVHVQKPGSEFVASAYDWRTKYGRTPKIGARPLIVLRTFGPVAFVFEQNDTEGDPLPDPIEEPFRAEGTITQSKVENFIWSMRYEGIASVEQDYGKFQAGGVRSIYATDEYIAGKAEKIFNIWFGMVVNKSLDPNAKMATMFHELGHVFCGHIRQPNAIWLPQRYTLATREMEFEAESVCWLVCERSGIKNPSAEYLSGYLDENGEVPFVSIEKQLG